MIKTTPEIEHLMAAWRAGAIGFPVEFVKFHQDIAMRDLYERLANGSWTLLKAPELVNDGWMDGMRVIRATVAVKFQEGGKDNWEVVTVTWQDSGAWFRECENGGRVRYEEPIVKGEVVR